jgi:hypothetical protein
LPRGGLGLAGAVTPLLPPGERVADGDSRRDWPLQHAYRSGDAEARYEADALVLDVADYGQVNTGLDSLLSALQALLLTIVASPVGCFSVPGIRLGLRVHQNRLPRGGPAYTHAAGETAVALATAATFARSHQVG